MSLRSEDKQKLVYVVATVLLICGTCFTISNAFLSFGGNGGEFKGVYTFEDDTNGLAPAGLTLNEGIGESYTVVSQYTAQSAYNNIRTHTKVLQLQHTRFMEYGYVQLDFSSPATGDNQVYEFWVCNPGPYSSNNIQIDIFFYNSTGSAVAGMNLDAGLMDGRAKSGSWVYDVLTYTMNSWMHIRFEFDITSKRYQIIVDETRDAGTYDLPATLDIQYVRFYTEQWYDNPSDGTYNVYVDAIGYSWHPDYVTGDNLNLIGSGNVGLSLNVALLVLGIVFIVIGLIAFVITISRSRNGTQYHPQEKSQDFRVETISAQRPMVQDQPIQSEGRAPVMKKRGNLSYCPYCGTAISAEIVSKYNEGEHVWCPMCNTEIS